jgi:hypothetical protein
LKCTKGRSGLAVTGSHGLIGPQGGGHLRWVACSSPTAGSFGAARRGKRAQRPRAPTAGPAVHVALGRIEAGTGRPHDALEQPVEDCAAARRDVGRAASGDVGEQWRPAVNLALPSRSPRERRVCAAANATASAV